MIDPQLGRLRWYMDDKGDLVYVDEVGQHLVNVHKLIDCAGPCPVHRPTDHHMRTWPIVWRGDRGIFERLCEHGIGHPDPDSMYYSAEFGAGDSGIHGCDGCCSG